MDLDIELRKAVNEHRKGNFSGAIELYRKLLIEAPERIDLVINTASALRQIREFTDALDLIGRYTVLFPDNGNLWYEKAITQWENHSVPAEVISSLENALAKGFRNAGICFFTADMYRLSAKTDEAIMYYSETVKHKPDHFMALFSLGMLYKDKGLVNESLDYLEKAYAVNPQSPEVCNNLGLVYEMKGELSAAGEFYSRGLKLKPHDMTICSNYVNLLSIQKKYDEAISLLVSLAGDGCANADIINGIGNLYWKKGDNTNAKEYYIKALNVKCDHAASHFNLGLVMREWNRLDEAIACFNKALRFDPHLTDAYLDLGEAYLTLGEIRDAEKIFRKVLELVPGQKAAYDNLFLAANYDENRTATDVFTLHKEWGDRFDSEKYELCVSKDPEKVLRIGYVSPDFCRHPVAQFLLPVFACRGRMFENYCYAEVIHRDTRTDEFRSLCSGFFETHGKTDDEVAERIKLDKIDILVDCSGHMNGNRLELFSKSCAPIKISAFGYPCTSGLAAIDYRITDSVTDNNESQKYYTEKLLFLDKCFCTFSPPENAPDSRSLPAFENGYITFGSLHTTARLNKKVVELWAMVLREIQSSRLLIFRTTLTASVIERLGGWFSAAGVDLSRIEFVSEIPSHGYLDIYNRIDCLLDTFPWSGHTTACESLWMGVPVITQRGDRYASRMVSSVLHHCGHEDWIAGSQSEYIDKTKTITSDLNNLDKIRKGLRQSLLQSDLMNNAAYTADIEDKYRKIWKSFCARNS